MTSLEELHLGNHFRYYSRAGQKIPIIHFVILGGGRYSQGDVRNMGISTVDILLRKYLEKKQEMYRQISSIRCTLIGNEIVDHSDVVGASPVGATPTTSSFST